MIKELETSETSTGGRMTGDERRKQILRVAIKLFSDYGFSGTTTKRIAQEAGVSEAMVFRHFATKRELYNAILDHKACEGEVMNPFKAVAGVMAEKDDHGVFYNLAYGALTHHEHSQEFMRLLLHAALEGHELADMFVEQNLVPLYEFLGGYIRQRQEDGVFKKVEPRLVVRAFVGMMIHHSLNNTLWDKNRMILNVSNEEAANAFADIILNGIKK